MNYQLQISGMVKASGLGLAAILVCLLSSANGFSQVASNLPTPAQDEAKRELNEAARAYREGRFAEAQLHSERALAVDPENRVAPSFIARTIHAQYKAGNLSPENLTVGQEAIAAYRRILLLVPNDEEAYKAIAYLYSSMKEEELFRDWIMKRATDTSLDVDKRAEAFVVLASKDWDCSFKITELPSNKTTTVDPTQNKALVSYNKPKDEAEFDRAQQCTAQGLELVDMAIMLTPENESAWSYRTNILLELKKLAEMSGDVPLKEQRQREYELALEQTTKLSKSAQEKAEKRERPVVP